MSLQRNKQLIIDALEGYQWHTQAELIHRIRLGNGGKDLKRFQLSAALSSLHATQVIETRKNPNQQAEPGQGVQWRLASDGIARWEELQNPSRVSTPGVNPALA